MKNRMINPQPLTMTRIAVWFENAKVNERRCVEGSYHLVEGGLLDEAMTELCSFDVIVSCSLIGHGFYLVANMSRLLEKLRLSTSHQPSLNKVEHFSRWLYQDMSLIVKEPMSAVTSTACSQPKCSLVRQAMEELLLSTFPQNCIFSNLSKHSSWTRGLLLGGIAGFSPVLSSLTHPSFVLSVCISKDGCYIVSGSSDGIVRIWDTLRGSCTSSLEGHNGGVESVAITDDGVTIFSCAFDTFIKKWDFVSGACISTFIGHSAPVLSISISESNSNNFSIHGSSESISIRNIGC
jgi:WD40 repeat protein